MLTVDGLVRQQAVLLFRLPREYWSEGYFALVKMAEKAIAVGGPGPHFVAQVVIAMRYARMNQHYTDHHLRKKHRPIPASAINPDQRNGRWSFDSLAINHKEPEPCLSLERKERDRRFYDDLSSLNPDCRAVGFLMLRGLSVKVITEVTGIKDDRLRRVRFTLIDALDLDDGSGAHASKVARVIELRRQGQTWQDIEHLTNLDISTAHIMWKVHCEITGEQDIVDKIVKLSSRGKSALQIAKETGVDIPRILRYISLANNTKLTEQHKNAIIGLLRHGWRYDRVARFFKSSRTNITTIAKEYSERTGINVMLEPFKKPTSDAIKARVAELAAQGLSARDIGAVTQTKWRTVNWIILKFTNIGPRITQYRANALSDDEALKQIMPLRRQCLGFHKISAQLHMIPRRVHQLWTDHCEKTGELDVPDRIMAMHSSGVRQREISRRLGMHPQAVSRWINKYEPESAGGFQRMSTGADVLHVADKGRALIGAK